MIARTSSNRTQATVRKKPSALQLLAERVAAKEIAFIHNDVFRRLSLKLKTPESFVQPRDQPERHSKMPAHLEYLCQTPLLTMNEEQALFQAMNFYKYEANRQRVKLNVKKPLRREVNSVQRYMAAADEVRNYIVSANTRLVMSIAKKFADGDATFDELLSEGINCLINAVDKFDYSRGFRFSTYATSAVSRDLVRLVKRHHRDKSRYSTGTDEIIAGRPSKQLAAKRSEQYLSHINRAIDISRDCLTDREQFIIDARYGFEDVGGKPTFQRLGQHLGISKERVRQLEIRALKKMRQQMPDFVIDTIDLAECDTS